MPLILHALSFQRLTASRRKLEDISVSSSPLTSLSSLDDLEDVPEHFNLDNDQDTLKAAEVSLQIICLPIC